MNNALVWMVLLGGCATLRSKADDAYNNGNYLAAQELYDQVVQGNPQDQSAVLRRDDARNAVLRVLLYQYDQASQPFAAAKLGELLQRRDGWALAVDPRIVPAIDIRVAATGAWLETQTSERASTVGPLAAEALVHANSALLAHGDFAPTRQALAVATKTAGAAKCATLDATTPYASWIVARYCAHFDVAREVPVLPNLANGVAINGAIAGESPAQLEALKTAAGAAFAKSAWYEPRAATVAHGALTGHVSASFSSHEVMRSKTWTESVPYTDYETSEESYQEPYDDTETYTESVPSTEWQTSSCAEPPCPQEAVTVYHDETKTRTVTKYRTAWRTVTNPVTRYRDEEREFTYQATERTGTYASLLELAITGEPVAATAHVDAAFARSGDDHDAVSTAAGVAPERANLPSLDDFATHEHARLVQRLAEVLDERYGARFCTLERYDLEAAATCAYRDATRTPPAARAQLQILLGFDEAFVAPLLGR